MIKTIILCDRCGKQLSDLEHPGRIKIEREIIEGEGTCCMGYKADFCDDCMAEIQEFIENKPKETQAAVPENVEKTECAEDKRQGNGFAKKYDTGKIIALKKAGWSSDKIAEEMGMTPEQVYNQIYNYKKKHPEEFQKGAKQ